MVPLEWVYGEPPRFAAGSHHVHFSHSSLPVSPSPIRILQNMELWWEIPYSPSPGRGFLTRKETIVDITGSVLYRKTRNYTLKCN